MSLSSRDKVLLACVLAVAVLAGGWYFLIRPVQADVGAKRQDLHAVQDEVGQRQDEVDRLSESADDHTARTVERLWLAKAVPVSSESAGPVVELQRIADRAGVELAAVRTASRSSYGTLEGTRYEIDVVGRFYNVDDFLYRVHAQVEVDRGDRPDIDGRLFATVKVDMGLDARDGVGASAGTRLEPSDIVRATVTLIAFNEAAGAPAGADESGTPTPSDGAGTAQAPSSTPQPGGEEGGSESSGGSRPGTTTTTTDAAPAPAGESGQPGPAQTPVQPGEGGTTP